MRKEASTGQLLADQGKLRHKAAAGQEHQQQDTWEGRAVWAAESAAQLSLLGTGNGTAGLGSQGEKVDRGERLAEIPEAVVSDCEGGRV